MTAILSSRALRPDHCLQRVFPFDPARVLYLVTNQQFWISSRHWSQHEGSLLPMGQLKSKNLQFRIDFLCKSMHLPYCTTTKLWILISQSLRTKVTWVQLHRYNNLLGLNKIILDCSKQVWNVIFLMRICIFYRLQHGLVGLWKRRGKGFEQFFLCNRDRSHLEYPTEPFWSLNDHLRHRCDGFRLLDRQVLGPLLVRDSHCAHIHMANTGGIGLVKTDSKNWI